DGRIWDLAAYEYSGDFFRSDPRGNNMIFMNEYDPERDAWVPSCECPFAFYDTDGDGESEVTIRVSAVPLDFDPWDPFDMDYGNAVSGYTGPFTERMRRPGAVNIRYSRDLDGLSSAERPLHYEMGFNLIGCVPYEFPGMARTHPLRRPPKTTRVIPHEDLIGVAERYPADRTGFTWREYGDDAIVLGSGAHAEEDRRWEGVFWSWSRRFMHNTGGPIQEWNVRREFRPTPSERRRLYWCRADRRIHLEGATDGWIRVGHLGDAEPWGEIRLFDTDRDGYFDRWETHLAGESSPARISAVRDPGVRELPGDWDALGRLYTGELLPSALASTRRLAEAMRGLVDPAVPAHLARALKAASCDSERLYIEGLILESRYLALRRKLNEESRALFERFGGENLRRKRGDLEGSIRAWKHARLGSDLDAAYGEGRFEDARRAIGELEALAAGETKQ
ncbi:MAG: hypothetical protein JXP34_07270, partial [Planctomycetes bacterium]|nr:hypothetical protein [Planctomycetota bacterium]